jgi:formiminotetrahydrofolate cyclodeaminase
VAFRDDRIEDFVDAVASVTPTLPAAGSVAALAGALAACLAKFVVSISLRKGALPTSTPRLQGMRERLSALREQCLRSMDEDVHACQVLMAAKCMPKKGQIDEARRNEAIREARLAVLAPAVSLAKCGLEILRVSLELVGKGYPVVRADAGVAAELGHACARAGLWIGGANLHELEGDPDAGRQRELLEVIRQETDYLFDRVKDELE